MPIRTSNISSAQTVKEAKDIGSVFLSMFGGYQQLILRELFSNLMETTPERTGTLRYNWRFQPGGKVGSFLQENDGTSRPYPREPEDVEYQRPFKEFTIYNNSPYINIVNSGLGGNENNQGFIQRALAMTDAKL